MKFLLYFILRFCSSIPAILLSLCFFGVFTTSGVRYILQLVTYFTENRFQATLLGGHIGTPITLQNLSWHSETIEITVNVLQFDWDPYPLWKGIWHFKTLQITDGLIQYHPSIETKLSLTKHRWPMIVVDDLSVQQVTWIDPKYRLPIETIHLKGQWRNDSWQVDELYICFSQGHLKGSGHIAPYGQTSLKLAFDHSHPPLSGTVQIDTHFLNDQWHWIINGESLLGHWYTEGINQQLSKADIDLRIGESTLQLQANINPKKSYLYGTISLKNFPSLTDNRLLTLTSHLKWEQTQKNSGELSFDLNTPELYLPLTVDKLMCHKKEDRWLFSGPGKIGPHVFNTKGVWHQTPTLKLEAQVLGKSIVYDNHLDTKIMFNPEVYFSWTPMEWGLNGTITIPEAEISRTRHQNSITLSRDIEIIDSNDPTPVISLRDNRILLDLLLGDKVHFQGYGLDTYLNGQLRLQYAKELLSTWGEINFIKGKYKAFGRVFDINQGYLQYGGGAITEPQILIRAQRTVLSADTPITVGVYITGLASNPKLRLFSTPPMAEPNILSYLLLNRAQTDLTREQGNILLQAAGALSTWAKPEQAEGLKLPVDELRLEHKDASKIAPSLDSDGNRLDPTNTFSQTALVVGKQLTDKLYVQYQAGIIDTLNTLHIQYILGEHVTLEADTGIEASGADLVWSFDGR